MLLTPGNIKWAKTLLNQGGAILCPTQRVVVWSIVICPTLKY